MPLVLFSSLFAWPEIERIITRDTRRHNIDDMPYEKPWRLGLGVSVFTFATVLGFAGSDDIQAKIFHIDVETLMIMYRFAVVLGPIICGMLAVLIGFELKARFESRAGKTHPSRAVLLRNDSGGYVEEHHVSD